MSLYGARLDSTTDRAIKQILEFSNNDNRGSNMELVTHSGIASLTPLRKRRHKRLSPTGPPSGEMINGPINAVPVTKNQPKVAPLGTSM